MTERSSSRQLTGSVERGDVPRPEMVGACGHQRWLLVMCPPSWVAALTALGVPSAQAIQRPGGAVRAPVSQEGGRARLRGRIHQPLSVPELQHVLLCLGRQGPRWSPVCGGGGGLPASLLPVIPGARNTQRRAGRPGSDVLRSIGWWPPFGAHAGSVRLQRDSQAREDFFLHRAEGLRLCELMAQPDICPCEVHPPLGQQS